MPRQAGNDGGFARFVKGRVRVALPSGNDADEHAPFVRSLLIALLLGVPISCGLSYATGGWVPAVVVALIGVCAIQGLWRGAGEIAGLVMGLVLAMLLAQPLGRALEGVVGPLVGASGLLGRFASTLCVGLLVGVVFWVVGAVVGRRVLKWRPQWRSADRLAGGAIGSLEGLLLALIVLWVPVALRPVASMRASMDQQEALAQGLSPEEAKARVASSARRILRFAEDIERTPVLGPTARATNPLEDAQALLLAEDFIAITRDPESMEALAKTQVWQSFVGLESMRRAREMIDQDPALKPLLAQQGVSIEAIRALLDNDTVLRVLDETNITQDLQTMQGPLTQTLREIASQAKARRGPL